MWEIQVGRLTTALLTIVSMVLIASWIKARKKYAHLPGPPSLPIVGNLLDFVVNNVSIVNTMMKIGKRYDGFFRLWLGPKPVVVVTDPEHLQIYYTSPHMIDRAETFYSVVNDVLQRTLFTANGLRWKKLRKIFTSCFNNTPTITHKNNIIDEQTTLLDELRKKANGPAFPCNLLLYQATGRTIVVNALGMRVDPEIQDMMMESSHFLMQTMWLRNFSPFYYFNAIFNLTPTGKRFWQRKEEIFKIVNEGVSDKLKEVKELNAKGEVLPNLYVNNLLKNHGDEPLDLLSGEVATTLITGADTTANTIGFALTVLGLLPEIQQKVYEEAQEIATRLDGRPPDHEDLKQYEYFERFIKETLRFFPVAPIIGRKCNQDTYFGKHLVPKGTDVFALSLYSHLNPNNFSDPYKFDPDRFLPENIKDLHPYAYQPFSAGPRGCPGKQYGTLVLKLTLPAIVREFKIYSDYNSLEEVMSNCDSEITYKDKRGHPIRLETRCPATPVTP